jgi:hypothetical protein
VPAESGDAVEERSNDAPRAAQEIAGE